MPRRVVAFHGGASEAIVRLHPDVKRRVRAAIGALREDAAEGEPLEGELSGFRKIVIGSWRIVYRLEAQVVRVYAIGRRVTVYSELIERLKRGIRERRGRYQRRPASAIGRSAPRAGRARRGSP